MEKHFLDTNLPELLKRPLVRNVCLALAGILILLMVVAMREVLWPLFLALAVAYVMDPVVDKMETWKMSRTWAIVVLIVLMVLGFLAFALYLIPKLIQQINSLSTILPEYLDRFRERFLPEVKTLAEDYQNEAFIWLKANGGEILSRVAKAMAASFASIGAFLANFISLLIVPVLAFYLTRDFDVMKGKAADLLPKKFRAPIVELFSELDGALGSFIKGQMMVALILAVIYSTGLAIAGCPAWLLIGFIAGLSNLVPYLGIALGLIPAVGLTYLAGNPLWQVILAAATFLIGQMLEGMVITPKIVGDSVGLHPVVVMVALMVGGTYFGMTGMILALPVAAVVMVLMRRGHRSYLNSQLFTEGKI